MIRRALGLALAAVAIVLTVVAAASPVRAHSGSNAVANLRTEVVTVPAGLEAQVNSDGSLITVRSTTAAVVTGYQGEPFLRFEGEQVFTNADSLTTYDAQRGVLDSIPASAGQGGVSWTPVADPGWFAWPDHRIAWSGAALPATVMDDPQHRHVVSTWSIPVTVDGVAGAITGRVLWAPPDGGQTFTVVALVGLIVLVVGLATWAAFPRRRTKL